MLPHSRIHCCSHDNRSRYSQMKCGEEVIGETGSEACNTVGCCRSDQEKIDRLGHENVIECAFEISTRVRAFEQVDVNFVSGESSESQRRHELRGAFRHQNGDVDATVLKTANNFRRLVAC